MVKIRDFYAALFQPEDYQKILSNNIQHLESIPMSKTFKTQEMIALGLIQPTEQPFFYIYSQQYLGHQSYGIVAEVSLEDYHLNHIKKHEKTLHRTGLNHQTYKLDHVGPVVISHKYNQQLDKLILNLTSINLPFSKWTTTDGRLHSLWRISQSQTNLQPLFASIQSLYILDGHHRFQAAYQNFLLKRSEGMKDEWIQALIYSSEYVVVHSQHRVVQNIPQNIQLIEELMKMQKLIVVEIVKEELVDAERELENYQIIVKLYESFFGINFRDCSRNSLDKVGAVRLQNQIFNQFVDREIFSSLKYVPGIIDQSQVYKNEVVFFTRQTQIETLFQIADSSHTMPPKSTWIQPKPCSHMIIRLNSD